MTWGFSPPSRNKYTIIILKKQYKKKRAPKHSLFL